MKKIFYGVIAFVVVLLIAIYAILFTSFGNNIVANIAQKKIKESAGLDVNITHFNLRFSSLELRANIANMADFNLKGALSPFKLGFDFDYLISLNQNYAKNLGLNLNQNLSFGGKIQGKASDFTLDGKGYLLGSNVLLNARMYNYSPIALNLDAQNLKIEEILHLLSYPSYAKGFLNAQAKISAQDLKPDGNIIIKLDTSYINYEAIKKDFSLDLPLNSNPKAEILANVKEDKIYAVSKIYNDYLNLQTQKTLYDISKNALSTDFNLSIPSLAKLEKLTKTRLNGSLGVIGQTSVVNNALSSLNAQVIGLGGEVKASLKNNKIFADINEASLEKLLALAGYGALVSGNLNAKLLNADLDFSNFDLEAKINNAKINTNELKKIAKIELPNTIFSLDTKANAKNSNISYNALLASNLLNIKKLQGTYNLKNSELNTDLNAFIDDLSQFSAIAGQKLQGKADLTAKAHIIGTQIQNLNANANLADGVIKVDSNGKKLDLNIDKLDLSKLFVIAGMPNYASGIVNAKVNLDNIDFNNLNGKANLEAKGILNATTLSNILNKNFPNNTSYDLNTKINFKNNIAQFDSVLNSSLADLTKLQGSFDIGKMLLNSDFSLKINDFSKLGFLLDRKLKGRAEFNGKVGFDKNLNFVVNSPNLFEGKLQSTLKDNLLLADLNGVDLSSLAQGLDFMDVYQGKADVKANYNLLSEEGEVNLDMKEGKLKPNLITNALKILTLKDITNDVYRTANAKALIKKENIKLDLNMQADRSYILVQSGALNSKSGALNLPFDIKLDRANFKGSITGTTENPKVNLNAGSVLNSIKNVVGSGVSDGIKSTGDKVDKAVNKLLNKIF
ncbi:hypothetical protein FPN63_01640 [Campylobacter jejuni]|uniref:hypothetical protein n=1 Tax=Campylobacter jejuni TaxID=197 RepID=UPI000873826E|nr:hypothetical protein [Campylobacter jejuni]ECL1093002.1 hypothetical protein [Campylobacter jejuni]OEV67987.1 hypothetical protein AJY73_00435 [Campylobacter jejuni]RTJ38013.1 hypothetical protein C3H75_00490 [Campylobacter jejuni]HDZ4272409.1 hypothetical protein [Campylobacter jejuni]HEH4157887.1 hypothetical protein [Campylobacter jejuni]